MVAAVSINAWIWRRRDASAVPSRFQKAARAAQPSSISVGELQPALRFARAIFARRYLREKADEHRSALLSQQSNSSAVRTGFSTDPFGTINCGATLRLPSPSVLPLPSIVHRVPSCFETSSALVRARRRAEICMPKLAKVPQPIYQATGWFGASLRPNRRERAQRSTQADATIKRPA